MAHAMHWPGTENCLECITTIAKAITVEIQNRYSGWAYIYFLQLKKYT